MSCQLSRSARPLSRQKPSTIALSKKVARPRVYLGGSKRSKCVTLQQCRGIRLALWIAKRPGEQTEGMSTMVSVKRLILSVYLARQVSMNASPIGIAETKSMLSESSSVRSPSKGHPHKLMPSRRVDPDACARWLLAWGRPTTCLRGIHAEAKLLSVLSGELVSHSPRLLWEAQV